MWEVHRVRSFPPKRTQSNYFLAGALGVELAGASLVAGAAVFFLTCFLCFFTFVVLGEAGALGVVGVWAARDRAAARAVPNIKVVKRFIVFFLLGRFSLPSVHQTRRPINRGLSAS
jgi:hypothetical protein